MQRVLNRFTIQQTVFLAISGLIFLQVAWWISLQMRETRRLVEARIATMKASRAEAWQMDSLRLIEAQKELESRIQHRTPEVEGRIPVLPTLQNRREVLERAFPYVRVVDRKVDEDDPPLLDQAAYLSLRPEPLREMERERTLALWRAGGQGSLMAFAILFGFFFIYRKLNQEIELKLRQKNFIASVTHELKTPIAALRVWIETIFSRELSREQLKRIQSLMDKDLYRLTELVGNLLDVARADAGSFEVRPEALNLEPWLRTVCESMDQRLGPGSLGLVLDLSPGISAMADPKTFATVVENLLSNAFKYASEPRTTRVTLDGDKDEAILVVSDQGMGFPPKEAARLFQRFYRVGDEMTRDQPGTGLGLFLCREIVHRHGGTIHAASKGIGMGSSFTIRLPRIT